jgi:preprotein translocase subunit SecY
LVIYRLGTYIPLPGIDPHIFQEIFSRNAGGILGPIDMFSGGALGRIDRRRGAPTYGPIAAEC